MKEESHSITIYARSLMRRRDRKGVSFLDDDLIKGKGYGKSIMELISNAEKCGKRDIMFFYNYSMSMRYMRRIYNRLCARDDEADTRRTYTTLSQKKIRIRKLHDIIYFIDPDDVKSGPHIYDEDAIKLRFDEKGEDSLDISKLLTREEKRYRSIFRDYLARLGISDADSSVFLKDLRAGISCKERWLSTFLTRDAYLISGLFVEEEIEEMVETGFDERKEDSFSNYISYTLLMNYLDQRGSDEEPSISEMLKNTCILFGGDKSDEPKLSEIDNVIKKEAAGIRLSHGDDSFAGKDTIGKWKEIRQKENENIEKWKGEVINKIAKLDHSLDRYCDSRGISKQDARDNLEDYLEIRYILRLKERDFLANSGILPNKTQEAVKQLKLGRTILDRETVLREYSRRFRPFDLRDRIVLDSGLRLNRNANAFIHFINLNLRNLGFPLLSEKRLFDCRLIWSVVLAYTLDPELNDKYPYHLDFFKLTD